MKFLLDSNVLLWAVFSPDELTEPAKAILRGPENELAVSLASLWELLGKIGRGRLLLAGTSVEAALQQIIDFGVEFLPVELDGSIRLEQTLYAEYPDLRPFISALEREKSTQFVGSLAKIWHNTEAEATNLAEQRTEVGFFEKTGEKDSPAYRVPFLYRPALDLVQGAAD